jgi:uncharacterized protein (TIGR02391 family)
MDLAAGIDPRLWAAVEHAYEARDYTATILDAVHFLGQLIRDRSGLESDGQALVGAAFGGANPVLKVNQLQTESDWNVQKGIESLLRGLYQAIRNPRSHQKHSDSLQSADAVVVFVNYVLQFVDGAKSPFEKAAFLARVFDTQFPENDRYAELLVSEVPPGQRFNILVEAYRTRESGRPSKLSYFFAHMLRSIGQEELSRFCDIISEDLKVTDSENSIRSVRQVLPDEHWPKLAEIARLRVESMFVASIRQGRYDSRIKKCEGGAFGTWAAGIERHFSLKDELEAALAEKLSSESDRERQYVLEFFFGRFPLCQHD